ncbi:MAG: phenylalanine--tRNA ligase subunit beta [Myxococcota bacterium]
MRISIDYLKNFIEIPYDDEKIINDLTLNGLEVEGVSKPYKDIDENIKIVDIISVKPHKDSPELFIVEINDGSKDITVICGARNVKAGVKGLWAPPDSIVLGHKINIREIKGVQSSGMLLSLEELGLEEKSEGIWLFNSTHKAGTPIIDILKRDTTLIEINITPNRGDALSYLGIARELSAYYNLKLKMPPSEFRRVQKASPIQIIVESPTECPLYQGTYAEKVYVKESDIYIQKLLIESNLRPINNIVDISNFIMLETGHPNHTFDFSYIKGGKIIVRNAKNGEKIKLLNGTELTLSEKNLLICDESSPVALAGVMGGEYSSILDSTNSILLECAVFNPDSIRLTTSMYNINSDSSYRFARGVDCDTVDYATKRFMYLLQMDIPEVLIYDTITIKSDELTKNKIIHFRLEKADRLLNKRIDRTFIKDVLENLGMNIKSEDRNIFEITIPSHRYDISCEEDIIEEIARIYGYNKFGSRLPHTEISETGMNLKDRFFRTIARALADFGLNEVINYTFISGETNSIFSDDTDILIKNPIAQDMASMRKSIIPSLLNTAVLNINRQNKDVRIFEIGKVFIRPTDIIEEEHLGILLSGRCYERLWANPQREFDFYDIKGIIENLLGILNIPDVSFTKSDLPQFLHNGKSARLILNGKSCGVVGELQPLTLKRFDLKQNVLVAELNLEQIFESFIRSYPVFKKYSLFPAVDRDIALVVSKDITSEEITNEIKKMNIPIVEEISIFDLYEGKGVEDGKKSIGIALKYRSYDSTLTDEEIDKIHSKIIDNLIKKFYARLR